MILKEESLINDGGQNEVEEKIGGQNAHKVIDAGRGTIFDKENWKHLQNRANLHQTKKSDLKKKTKVRSKLIKGGKNVQEIVKFFECANKTKKHQPKIEKSAATEKLGVVVMGGINQKRSLLGTQPGELSSISTILKQWDRDRTK